MMYRVSQPLAETQFPDDDKKKKKKKKSSIKRSTKTVPYTMKDLTPAQRKKINSVNLSPSAKQKAINTFAKNN